MKQSRTSELIKSKINCFDLIDEFNLEVTKCSDGESYRTYSFTHDGHNHTSMQIWKDSWFCHSSKISGDVISMYAWLKFNGDNSLAFKDLMHKLGIGTDDEQSEEFKMYLDDVNRLRANVKQFHANLKPEHRQYFYNRHISDDFIDSHKCGYDPSTDRIIIPVFKNGSPIYYCARAFDNSKISKTYPKYKKPSIGFSSYVENELYGLDTLKRDNNVLWIAEGVFDYASLWQDGKTVLCNATGLSNKHIDYVVKIAQSYKRVYICFDNDSQGKKFAQRMYKALFEHNIPFMLVTIPDEYNGKKIKDISDAYCNALLPDELAERYATDGVQKYLKQYEDYDDLYDYLYPLAPYIGRKIKRSVNQFINQHFDKEDIKDLEHMLKRGKTQNEYARDFIKIYDHELWYDPVQGFYEFNGKYWQPVDEIMLRQCFEENFDIRNNDEKSIFDKVKVQSAKKGMPVANQKECFNVNNGTLYFDKENIEKPWKFVENHDKNDYCTYCQPYDFNPNANDDEFNEFVHKVFYNHPQGEMNMRMRYDEYLGSVFFKDNVESKAIMWVGQGSNGKTKLNEILEKMLSESLWSSIPVHALGKEFRLQELIGKYVNFFHDPKPDTYENESIMKAIIDNNSLSTNVKNKAPRTFKSQASIFIDANDMFHPKDKSNGWLRRFEDTTHYLYNRFSTDEMEIDNETCFKADKYIIKKLCTNDGCSAILNHMLSGYERIVKNDYRYTPIPIDDQADRDLKSAGNHLYLFASEFDFDFANERGGQAFKHDEIEAQRFYEVYDEWFNEKGYLSKYEMSKDGFFKRILLELQRTGKAVEKRKTKKCNIYVNMKPNS